MTDHELNDAGDEVTADGEESASAGVRPTESHDEPPRVVEPTNDPAPADAEIPSEEAEPAEAGDRALVTENGAAQPESNENEAPTPPAEPPRTSAAVSDDTSDVGSIPDEPVEDSKTPTSQLRSGDWQAEMSAHRIAVELKRIETRIRELLSERDTRRKRKLAGTFRWHELEEDIIGWRADRRFDNDTLDELHRLVGRRHYLFCQLRFAASTRPTWNS